ncbi:hypothetical protein, partial [Streptomyces sp. NPDC002172]
RPALATPRERPVGGQSRAAGGAALLAPVAWPGPAGSLVLSAAAAAAAAQAGDAAIGVATRKWTMIAGASLLTVVHTATAVATA